MPEKVAFIIDGGFVKKKLHARLGHFPSAQDIVNHCTALLGCPELSGATLFRYYYYDAYPLEKQLSNPLDHSQLNLTHSPQASQNRSLIESLEMFPFFAVRKGNLTCHGWKIGDRALAGLLRGTKTSVLGPDLVPDIEQKGVDIKIGLDIAWIASRKIVDILVLICSDSDLIPAMKFARKEGIKVFISTLGHGVYRELKVHCDLVLD